MFGIRGINLAWFRSYLSNRKQYILLGHDLKTGTQNILCGLPQGSILGPLLSLLYILCRVPQGSILGPLLSLLYVNDLSNSSILDPIMFADDRNLSFEHTDLRIFFSMVNDELNKIYEWFNAEMKFH